MEDDGLLLLNVVFVVAALVLGVVDRDGLLDEVLALADVALVEVDQVAAGIGTEGALPNSYVNMFLFKIGLLFKFLILPCRGLDS